MCNFLGSILLQQRFETVDQCYSSVMAQSFIQQTSSVQFSCSVMSHSLRPRGLQHARPPCPHHILEFAQVRVHCISDVVQPSHPLTPSSPLPSIFPSVKDLSNESSVHIRWPKYWSFSFSISPSSEYSGLISFKIDWLISLLSKGRSGLFSSTTVQSWFIMLC